MRRDARVRLAAIVVGNDARHRWKLLLQRPTRAVMAIEGRPLTCVDFRADRRNLIAALASLDWRHAGVLAAARDVPVTAHPGLSPDERETLRRCLRRQQEAEGTGTNAFPLGHHSFIHGAPNALARVLLPLFRRIKDFTLSERVSRVGLPADILDDDIDNPEPVTALHPRE